MELKSPRFILRYLSGSILLVAAAANAATDYMIDTYSRATGAMAITNWQQLWGSASNTVTFDPLVDVINDTNHSGSARFEVQFSDFNPSDLCLGRPLDSRPWNWSGNYLANTNSQYYSLEFDILWSTNSPRGGSNLWAKFNNMPVDGAGNWEWSNSAYDVVTNNPGQWQHVMHRFPLTFNPPYLYGWAFYLFQNNTNAHEQNCGGAANCILGPTVFWLDNVKFAAYAPCPMPWPVLSIRPFSEPRGLALFASSYNSASQRQNIRTVNSFPWVGSTVPVTYSLTITNFPDAAHSGFEAHLFLVSGTPGNESAADHNEPNVVYLQVLNNADGTARANFMFKTNNPGSSDPSVYVPNTLGSISNASALGTWSARFTSDTNITLTAPGGASTNFTMPPNAAALFDGSLYGYCGITPNNINNCGQSAIFSKVEIVSGATTNVSDSFLAYPLDTTNWTVLAESPGGVFPLPPHAAYWVSWTLPDTDFQFQTTTNLLNTNSWAAPLSAVLFQNNTRRTALLSSEPGANTRFFRLKHPGFF